MVCSADGATATAASSGNATESSICCTVTWGGSSLAGDGAGDFLPLCLPVVLPLLLPVAKQALFVKVVDSAESEAAVELAAGLESIAEVVVMLAQARSELTRQRGVISMVPEAALYLKQLRTWQTQWRLQHSL